MRPQSGFTTLSVTLILMLILLALSLLVGKVLVSDRRISLNEVQYRQAVALAEQGLSDGFGRVASVDWRGSVTISGALGSYTVLAQNASAAVVGGTTVVPVVIRSVATLKDGQAQAVAEAKYVSKPVVTDIPGAPLTLAGGGGIGGTGIVLANPNGGGPGVPVSVWTDETLDGHGNWETCHAENYSGGNSCSDNISSAKDGKKSDIKESDPDFPKDLVKYLFDIDGTVTSGNEWWNKLGVAKVACNDLATTAAKIIMVTGNCSLPDQLGSQSSPVVLIVKDGDITMNAKSNFSGLLFAYSTPTSPTATPTSYNIKLNGGATLNGIFVANYEMDKLNGNYLVKYDESILNAIKHGVAFKELKIVPGSWRDW
ncbi:PilX N-terminal domain-containing pilus assembly protein [Aeromonas sp. PS2Canimalfood6]|uniref:PilX N-terminal domain-containing pilus assembly protein n=1 Tax=Aeromonas TaxID=642 RepID=UPI0029D9528F|nr:PilX N-terminal domain-containing pilus assembly protein [Aeromonas caviae]MDX7822926.1 hypothetical protein [Aeromonas caviae]